MANKYLYGTCRGMDARKNRETGKVDFNLKSTDYASSDLWVPASKHWWNNFHPYDIQPLEKLSWYEKLEVWIIICCIVISVGLIIGFIMFLK